MYYIIKIVSSALLILLISEIAKRSSFIGALIASLPFVSIIAFIFLYEETKDSNQIIDLSKDIFWLVIPSLALFLSLPFLIQKGFSFYPALGIASLITIASYFLMIFIMKQFGL